MSIQLNFSCHENWNKMTPSEQGRFCDSCAKNVFDLTDKTDDEIRLLYAQNNGKMCGRIRSTQLNRPLISTKKMNLSRFCCALFFVFGSFLFNYELKAQSLTTKEKMTFQHNLGEGRVIKAVNTQEDLSGQRTTLLNNDVKQNVQQQFDYSIQGVVTDRQTGDLLPFVTVYFEFESKRYGAMTDLDGKYMISIPKFIDPTKPLELNFKFVGYDDAIVKNIVLSSLKKELLVLDVRMESQEFLLLGDIMIEDHHIINTDPEKQGETNFDAEDLKRSPY